LRLGRGPSWSAWRSCSSGRGDDVIVTEDYVFGVVDNGAVLPEGDLGVVRAHRAHVKEPEEVGVRGELRDDLRPLRPVAEILDDCLVAARVLDAGLNLHRDGLVVVAVIEAYIDVLVLDW